MNPQIIGFRPQRFPQKWMGRQVYLEVKLKEMDRQDAIRICSMALGHTTVQFPD